jgi:signal transduction histidine kinase
MSLRLRLTLAYVGLFAVALLALDIGLYFVVNRALINSIDNELDLGAQVLQQNFTEAATNPSVLIGGSDLPAFLSQSAALSSFTATNLLVVVYDGNGRSIDYSPNVKRTPRLATQLDLGREIVYESLDGRIQRFTTDIGDARLRVLMVPLRYSNGITESVQTAGVIQLARPIDETERALTVFLYALAFGGIVVLVVASQGGAWLTRAAFRPIDVMARTVQGIVSASDLKQRVPVPEVQDELQRLTMTVNDLLDRIEQLFETQRRFLADASHELRTPLAAMQGNIEILNRGAARDPELLKESLADMQRESARLIRLVNDLLMLARNEAAAGMRFVLVDLAELMMEVVRELKPIAGQVDLVLDIKGIAIVEGDRDRLKQALLNVCMNALQHTPAGGRVVCTLMNNGERAIMTIADTGSGIAPDDLPFIFDRFYRADRSRTRGHTSNSSGAGLGLAIVKYIVEAHKGNVTVASTLNEGTTFGLSLPRITASFED